MFLRRSWKRLYKGFTLVELLVVVTIIGLLIALLLPAVQAAREAGRRAQCLNHLKQIGLAMHNHHDTYGRFPPGGARDQAPFGTAAAPSGGQWGSSWMIYLLPYLEHNTLFDRWSLAGGSGWGNNSNLTLLDGVNIPEYRCPSSLLPVLSQNAATLSHAAAANYVGISGAAGGLIPGFSESRLNTLPAAGIVSGGGVLFPNSQVAIANLFDGSSNTMAVSEQGDYIMDNTGKPQDWRASQPWGFHIGVRSTASPPNFYADSTATDNRSSNCITIRYRLDLKKGSSGTGWANDVATTGVGSYVGANTPVNSAHAGGVNALFCDGSVRFLIDATPLETLARLATRDDGQPTPEP